MCYTLAHQIAAASAGLMCIPRPDPCLVIILQRCDADMNMDIGEPSRVATDMIEDIEHSIMQL